MKKFQYHYCLNEKSISNQHLLSAKEISSFFYFPDNPRNETSLLKAMSVRLSLATGIPTFSSTIDPKNGEVIPKDVPREATVIGISDYRSIRVPIGIYEEDQSQTRVYCR
jgi:hypothetical protein